MPLLPGFRVDNRGTARFLLQISLVARWAKDLDYPNGMGSPDNVVHNIFWPPCPVCTGESCLFGEGSPCDAISSGWFKESFGVPIPNLQ